MSTHPKIRILATAARGFTLIEMLVVIAIIALLASLLVPGIGRALRKSYQGACASNMKQTTAALTMFVDDNDQWLPPAPASPVGLLCGQGAWYNTGSKDFLIYYIAKHLGMSGPSSGTQIAKVFFCPGFKRYGPAVTSEVNRIDYGLYTTGMSWTNIGFLPFGYPVGVDGTSAQPNHRITDVASPAEIYAMSDVDQQVVTDPANTWQSQLPVTPVHVMTRNFMFFDSHIGQRPINVPNKL